VAISGIEITDMNKADLPEIQAIENVVFLAPWSEQMLRRELLSPLSSCRVARARQGRSLVVAGYLICWIYAAETHIHNLAVKQEFRRMGVGGLLLADAIQLSRKKAAEWVYLEVRRSNCAAIRLYEKFAFLELGVRKSYYRESGEDALVLGRQI